MKLNDVINKVQNINWTKINNFSIILMPNDLQFSSLINWDRGSEFNDTLNTALVSIETPAYTAAEVSTFVGNTWRYHQGRDELFKFQLTFRDYNQMALYTLFRNAYEKSKDQYADRVKFQLKIFSDADKNVQQKNILEIDDAILINVSQVQFSHKTENEIAEFNVQFMSNPPKHPNGFILGTPTIAMIK